MRLPKSNLIIQVMLLAVLANAGANFVYCQMHFDGFHDLLFVGKQMNGKNLLFLGGNYKEVGETNFLFMRQWTKILIAQFSVSFLIMIYLSVIRKDVNGENNSD